MCRRNARAVSAHNSVGDSNDAFVKWLCLAFYKIGWRPVAFNYRQGYSFSLHLSAPRDSKSYDNTLYADCCRGCGGVPLTTPKIFCQADTSDMYLAVKEIRSLFPEAAVFGVGFSLGGYTLNKYLGQVDTAVYGPGELHQEIHLHFTCAGHDKTYNECSRWQCTTFDGSLQRQELLPLGSTKPSFYASSRWMESYSEVS